MSRKRILCISLGSIGKRHLRNTRILLPDAEIAVYRQFTEDDKQVPDGADKLFFNLADALEFKPEVVIISSPASEHVKNAIAFLELGSHLMIEKPLSNSSEGLNKLIELSKGKESQFVMVAYVLRFLPALQSIKSSIDEGRFGDVRTARIYVGQYLPDWRPGTDYRKGVSAQKSLGGGALLELSHELDYGVWLFGNPDSIICSAAKISELEIDVEDAATVIYEYGTDSSKKRVNIEVDFLQRVPRMGLEIVGSRSTVVVDLMKESAVIFDVDSPEGAEFPLPKLLDGNDVYLRQMDLLFSRSFQDYSPRYPETDCYEDYVDLDQAVRVMQIVDAAKRSTKSGMRQEV